MKALARAVAVLVRLDPPMDNKPVQCESCKGRPVLRHIRVPGGINRYAQVFCVTCGAAGPEVRFELSDEWPHIAAEKTALAKWAWMQRKR